jgi:hypothetical protein
MIYYLTASRHAGAMGAYLETLGKSLATRLKILSYERLFSGQAITLPRATYIFTSIGLPLGSYQPPSPTRLLVARLREALINRHGPASVLNDPMSSLRRHALLRTLHERGINRFAAHRANALPDTARFPLFLRREAGAQWTKIPLLHNRREYAAALAGMAAPDGLLAVEFCDTRDGQGIYRKYGAFVIGDHIVPRHLFFSRDWMVKTADLKSAAQLAEELDYINSNPHAEALQEISRLAQIGYGRIDYAIHSGRVQVWEINTTPSLISPPGPDDALRREAHERFAAAFATALDRIDIGNT